MCKLIIEHNYFDDLHLTCIFLQCCLLFSNGVLTQFRPLKNRSTITASPI